MKIIHADGSIEDKPENYRHQWSPADILAIDIPPENRPTVGNPHHKIKRQSSAELKADNQKRTAIARQVRADKRKTQIGNLKPCTTHQCLPHMTAPTISPTTSQVNELK